MTTTKFFFSIIVLLFLSSCGSEDDVYEEIDPFKYTKIAFGTNINVDQLANYANQTIPNYIIFDNTNGNPITDKGATLGRILFYDKNLSSNNTISCASCHKQELAFGDDAIISQGVNGLTGRHSMRLVNNRFSQETKYFWDERALNLETQTTMPIKDHGEMGFSGENGDLNFTDLLTKLNAIGYYKELFKFVYNSEEVTENKIQLALSQFIRSIQSFDSKYDIGRSGVTLDTENFENFNQLEQTGKSLFLSEPIFNDDGVRTTGGLGCVQCHIAPTFSINPLRKNNGVIGVIGNPNQVDLFNTKSPSLRNVFNSNGISNGPFMHTGNFSIDDVYNHYSNNPENGLNTNLEDILSLNGVNLKLNIRNVEKNALTAFLKTLSGINVYTDPKWSDPFLN